MQTAAGSHKIYLLHGFGGLPVQLSKVNKMLMKEGYLTENCKYNSIHDLDNLGKDLYQKIIRENYDTVSFVTHSMGGLVVRSMLQYIDSAPAFPTIFRIIMLAPPNKGAVIADFFQSPIVKKLVGSNVEYMCTDSTSYAHHLPVPLGAKVGIISGVRGKKPYYNPFVRIDNDGFVASEDVSLGIGEEVAIIKGATHNNLLFREEVIQMICDFMKNGTFQKE